MSDVESFLDQRVIDLVNSYITSNANPETKVTHHLPPEKLRSKIDLTLPENGSSLDELYLTIEQYLNFSVRTGHRQFFNQLWSGFTLPGFLGEIIASLANTSMYTYEVAPVATLMEKELIKKLGSICGFKNPEGMFVTGGSNGNLQAMMIARNRALPFVKSHGYKDSPELMAFVSEEAHYSFEKSANILGLGSANLRKIKTDDRGRMIPEELAMAIEQSSQKGKAPFFVGATAGTTVKGAFDPLTEIASIARQHDLWFHVDGSLGGTVVLSARHRHLLRDLVKADSFIWNAHKLMGLPLICSILLIREKGHLLQTNSVTGTDYIFHDEAYGACDLGPMSLQCGRRVDALKLWLSWKYYGDLGYAERVDRFFELAAFAEDIVSRTPSLELMAPRSSVNVCFRYIPNTSEDIDKFNLDLREELARKGKALVNFARLGENVAIRLVIANHELAREDISRFFDYLIQTAESLDR
ncbi:MAG: aminotransferase class V-fold PLP-dependent enzyme [Candidatus Aminicenantes bacterium]|nr:MAG: aminotransferase class V-fold PLP-dependent enzyme [Candidatus Aminicenantes bacterium]